MWFRFLRVGEKLKSSEKKEGLLTAHAYIINIEIFSGLSRIALADTRQMHFEPKKNKFIANAFRR